MKTRYTIKELIETLQRFPQDLPVLVRGYDEGYDDLGKLTIEKIKYTPSNSIWKGDFTACEDGVDTFILEA